MKLCERPSLFVSVSSSSTEKKSKKEEAERVEAIFSASSPLLFSLLHPGVEVPASESAARDGSGPFPPRICHFTKRGSEAVECDRFSLFSHLSFSLSLFLSLLPNPPQAMSFGLTQYDVEELIAYCGGACKWF